jgi:hypothetical protein
MIGALFLYQSGGLVVAGLAEVDNDAANGVEV